MREIAFRTGFILDRRPRGRCCGAGWEATVQEANQRDITGHSRIVILSRTQRNAQSACELIWECLWIFNGGGIDLNEYPEVEPCRSPIGPTDPWIERSEFGTMRPGKWSLSTAGIAEACLMAARASRRRPLRYAVHHLAMSQSLAAIHHMDLDPSHWRHRPAVSPFGRDHVRLAYAVIAAYTAIEQLGLEVRASSAKPSKINGTWNPVVRQDLEKRLTAANVDLSELAVWTRRSTPRRIERLRPAQALSTPDWACGRIRDTEIDVVDAISDLSWLRSKIAAHKLSRDSESLTLYEVSNAQYLARRLLLSKLGFWRIWEDRDEVDAWEV